MMRQYLSVLIATLAAITPTARALNADALIAATSDTELSEIIVSAVNALQRRRSDPQSARTFENSQLAGVVGTLCATADAHITEAGAASSTASDPEVVVLTYATVEAAVAETDTLLVLLYNPTCGHCSAMMPEYDAAAKLLAEKDFGGVLAKCDVTEDDGTIAGVFNVKHYPQLDLYRNGQYVTEYKGKRAAIEIAKWVIF
jgi:thiol-disulfide isomerase/thioredoxin